MKRSDFETLVTDVCRHWMDDDQSFFFELLASLTPLEAAAIALACGGRMSREIPGGAGWLRLSLERRVIDYELRPPDGTSRPRG